MPKAAEVVQECGVGLIRIRRDGDRLAFAAPPLIRSGAVEPSVVATIARGIGLDASSIKAARWADNGPGWVAAMLGSRAPASLKIFLTALAIIDDLLAVLIIALFYGSGLSPLFLGLAAGTLAVLYAMNRLGVRQLWPYLMVGAALWFFVLKSGIHATIAGVLLAFVIPNGPGDNWPARKLEDGLANPVAYGIVPVFAFANAGVALGGISFATFLQPITLGVAAGLFFGKQIGILGACWLGVKLGIAKLPVRANWVQVYGVSLLCGIGFTISLFIGALAFTSPDNVAAAKLGVLAGSLIAGVGGWLVLHQAGAKGVKT